MTDPFGRCPATTKLYEVQGEDARCRHGNGHDGSHEANATPDSRDANIVSWDTPVPQGKTRPQCRAQLHFEGAEYRCVLPEDHPGMHQDLDADSWDITYVDEPGVSPQAIFVDIRVRPVQDQLTALTARVGLLGADRACAPVYLAEPGMEQGNYLHGRAQGDLIKELYQRVSQLETDSRRLHDRLTRYNPVCGHRDPSSGLACQRPPDHYGEIHKDVTGDRDGTAWTTDHGSAEHRRDEQAGLESTDNPVYLDLSHLGDGTVQCVRNLAHPGNRLS